MGHNARPGWCMRQLCRQTKRDLLLLCSGGTYAHWSAKTLIRFIHERLRLQDDLDSSLHAPCMDTLYAPPTCVRAADASVAPLRMSIAGLTAVRLPVLLGRCVALLLRCRATGLGCSRGCSMGSCCTPGAVGEGLEGIAAPPSLLFFLGCIIYFASGAAGPVARTVCPAKNR